MYQALRVTPEVTVGTFDPTVGAGALVRLDTSNAFPGRPQPIIHHIRSAEGSNRPVHSRSSQDALRGRFSSLLYYAQAAKLLPWAFNITGSPLKLPSVTIDHVLQMGDTGGTMVYQRFLGCYCDRFHFTANNNGAGVLARMDFDFLFLDTATITVTDFATPALSAYPTAAEAVFQQMDGGLTIGTLRAEIKSFDLTIANILKPQYDAKKRPVRIRWCGRDVSFSSKLLYKATTDRTAFNALTAKTCAAVLTDGTNTITFDFQTNDLFTNVEDDLPLDDEESQTLSVMSRVDGTSGTDVTLTIAP